MFPDMMNNCCQTVLDSHILRDIIALVRHNSDHKVSLDISANQVTIVTGLNGCWSFHIRKHEENFEAMVLTDDNNYHALFKMEHLEALTKALTVARRYRLVLYIDPSGSIVMRFKFDEVSELVFLYKSMLIMSNTRNYDVGDKLENTSQILHFFIH